MVTSTDPRAASFDATAFRSAITFAMNMGLPETQADRPTFRWTVQKTFTVADPHGKPYNLNTSIPSSTTTHGDVQISCAIEFVARASLAAGTPVGQFDTPRVVLTVLDSDYPSVQGADLVLLGQNTYTVEYVEPPIGLFAVTVYRIHCIARDET